MKSLRPTHHKLHYTRDVTLREDASRIRKNPGIFAKIRSFAYNILRFNQRDSVAQRLRRPGPLRRRSRWPQYPALNELL